MGAIIAALISGAIVGYGGRLILPGAQDIGLVKTVALGIVAALAVGAVFSTTDVSWIVSTLVAAFVAAGLLWGAIRMGLLKA